MGKGWITVNQARIRYNIPRTAILRAVYRGEVKAKIYRGSVRTRVWVLEKSLVRWARHYGLGKYDLSDMKPEHMMGCGPLTVQQAAQLCGVPPIRIYRLLYTGQLRAKRTPRGHWRIDPWSLRDWAMAAGLQISDNLRWVSTERQIRLVREFFRVASKACSYATKHNIPLPEGWINTLLQQIHNREKERHLDLRGLVSRD